MLIFGAGAPQGLRQVTIVALGDSTTAGSPGFRSPVEAPPKGSGNPKSQYAYWIRKQHPEWKILNRGIFGERTDQILKRFERDVLRHPPDLVIILAGVNDLVQGDSSEQIEENLEALYDRAERAGIKILACTMLPYNNGLTPEIHRHMVQVNEWIRATSRARGFGFCDTYRLLGDPARPGHLINTADGLHPDVKGYRKMGRAIRESLEKLLEKERG